MNSNLSAATLLGAYLLRFGELQVDLLAARVYLEGQEVALTTVQYRLMVLLVRDSGVGAITQREALYSWIYPEGNATERCVDAHISFLRKKFRTSRIRFKSISGVGYQLVLEGAKPMAFVTTVHPELPRGGM